MSQCLLRTHPTLRLEIFESRFDLRPLLLCPPARLQLTLTTRTATEGDEIRAGEVHIGGWITNVRCLQVLSRVGVGVVVAVVVGGGGGEVKAVAMAMVNVLL